MNEKITLQDLINLFGEKQSMSKKDAELFVRTLFDLIEEALATEKYVKVKGFGTFKLTEVESRESVNVNTGERIEIQGHTKVSFTPDTAMKDLINKPFAHFETVILNDGVELEDTLVEEVVDENVTDEVPIIMETQSEPVVETPAPVEEPMVEMPTEEEPQTEEVIIEEPIVEEPIVAETVTEEPVQEVNEEETSVEEPVIQEEIPIVESQPEIIETKEKTTNRVLWGIIVVLVLIILFGAYWMFLRPTDTPEVIPAPPVQEELVETPAPIAEEKPQEETPKTVQFIELSEEELRKERVPSFADTLDYQIVGTQEEYTLQKGETIIRASVRFFGTKKYWPYIVKHNMDVLPDPDNIPAGIRIKIPKLVEKK